jgi:hypothetical protein
MIWQSVSAWFNVKIHRIWLSISDLKGPVWARQQVLLRIEQDIACWAETDISDGVLFHPNIISLSEDAFLRLYIDFTKHSSLLAQEVAEYLSVLKMSFQLPQHHV